MITGVKVLQTLKNMYYVNINVNLMVKSVIQIKSGIMINVDCQCKKHNICEKDYILNPATCSCENGKYLVNIMDDSVITCDKIIKRKLFRQILMKKNQSIKH